MSQCFWNFRMLTSYLLIFRWYEVLGAMLIAQFLWLWKLFPLRISVFFKVWAWFRQTNIIWWLMFSINSYQNNFMFSAYGWVLRLLLSCWTGNRTFRMEECVSNSCSNLICRICLLGKRQEVAFTKSIYPAWGGGGTSTWESSVSLICEKFIFPFYTAKVINFLNKAKVPVLIIPMMV